jgi:hypothetical protein
VRRSAATEYGKGEDEDHDLGASVEGGGKDVVVLDEPAGVVLPVKRVRLNRMEYQNC